MFETRNRPGHVGGVTVDHGLQEGSAEHADRVVAQMARLGADETAAVRVTVETGGRGLEAAAREARYAVLEEVASRMGSHAVLLGHTLDHIESGSAAAPLFVLQTRLASLQAASDVTDLAMKACGGAAFSRHLGLERVFRDARAGWVMAPTVDHLLEFSGRALTGLPLFG